MGALISPAEWRVYYPALEGDDEDDVIEELIDATDNLLAAYAGFPLTINGSYTLLPATYESFLDGPSLLQSAVLCLCVHPLIDVTDLRADVTRAYGDDTIRVLETDFDMDQTRGLLILRPGASAWPVGYRAIRVQFGGGWDPVPPGLRAICAATVRHLWDRRQTQGQSSYSSLGDSASLTDTDALIPQAARDAMWGYLTPCAKARLMREQAAAR